MAKIELNIHERCISSYSSNKVYAVLMAREDKSNKQAASRASISQDTGQTVAFNIANINRGSAAQCSARDLLSLGRIGIAHSDRFILTFHL
jgi:hypothetical protein